MNNKAKVWLAGGLAAAVALFAVGYFIVVKPKKDDVSAKRTQVSGLQAENSRLQGQINQLLAQSKQITQKQIELAKVANRVPADPGLPSLVRRLAADALDSDVDLVNITPTTPTTASPYVTGAAAYSQIGLSLEVHGTYAGLHEWFTHLEDSQRRLIVVESVNLTEPKASDTSGKTSLGADGIPETPRTLTATITARTFSTDPATVTADLPALSKPAAANPSTTTTS